MSGSGTRASTDLADVLRASGEVGRDLLAVDWARTPLGPPSGWSRSLTTMVRVLVSSRFSMWMAWGPELTFFCNDAYRRDTLGAKYPWALGRPAYEVWQEIWPDIGPRIDTVMQTGEATWDEALLLFLERSGFREETYHTFSYSPLNDDDGRIVGMLCVVVEETERVVAARRLALLHALGSAAIADREEAGVLAGMAEVLGRFDASLPFTLTYLFDEGGAPRLAASTGAEDDHPVARVAWPLADVRAGRSTVVELEGLAADLPTGPWEDPPSHAMVVPLAGQPGDGPLGFLVAALNPYRPFDDGHRSFVELAGAQVATGIGTARAYDDQRRRAEQLAELDRAKTAFFTNVSHELRTPLTLLLGPAEDALADQDAPLPDVQRHRVELVARNGQRLLTLVNALLDFSRLEAGSATARYQPTDLARATTDLTAMFASAADAAGLELRVDAEPLGEPVLVDREMWTKIVSNLVSNALKHTFHGSIVVGVRRAGRMAELTVTDTGVGIPEEDQPKLFERFHRVAGAQSRTHEGTGIGLALVAELVALHGGTVDLDSTFGQGSTFTVRLPLGAAHLPADQVADETGATVAEGTASALVSETLRWLEPERRETMVTEAAPAGDRARVLVVDDNVDMRGYVTELLRDQYDVVEAPDGAAALDLVRADPPDLVLTDVMMPVLDGFGLLAALREDPVSAGLPVVMVSARGGEDSTIEGLEAGADDYLVKPFAARELLARVRANLELDRIRRSRDELERSRAMLDRAERLARVGSWERVLPDGPVRASAQLLEMLGVDAEGLARMRPQDTVARLIAPEDQPAVLAELDRCLREGGPFSYDARLVLPDGSEGEVRVRGEVTLDEEGRPTHLRGSLQDVTEQLRVERELAAAARDREVAEREHHIADELQRSLLPTRVFDFEHLEIATYYRPGVQGTQVGGDWFDVIDLPGGGTALVLGDVMGRGVRAAAVMGQLRAAIRAYAQLDMAPDDVLRHLDGVLLGLDEEQMATCVYAVLSPDGRSLRYASAGHPPPLLRLPGGEARRLDTAVGPPVGSGVPHPGAEDVDLPPDALLVLYTDGLVERRGRSVGDGIELLAGEVTASTTPLVGVPGALVGALVPDEPDDDVAVLVARVRGASHELPRLELLVDRDPRAVRTARHATADALEAWDVVPPRSDEVVLLVSELVTNAIRHGSGPIRFVLELHPEHLLLEVHDGDLRPPHRRTARLDEESGRGLALVAMLATQWGARATSGGKAVWAVLDRA